MLFNKKQYDQLNKRLIIKAIQELTFEEVFLPAQESSEDYHLRFSEKVVYSFSACKGAWGDLQIRPLSLQKIYDGQACDFYTLSSFFREAQQACQISGPVLAAYIEEAHQTLYSLLAQEESLNKLNFNDLVNLSFSELDQLLMGHPKLIMSHGRIGLNSNDLELYAPENQTPFKLRWLAVKRELIQSDECSESMMQKLAHEGLGPKDLDDIEKNVPGKLHRDFQLIPVHPWQWEKYVLVQFYDLFCQSLMIDLGERGHDYRAQSSLRTLTRKKESAFDIKLPLSILNTSCIRGLPAKHIKKSALVSHEISKIVSRDHFLNIQVLKEVHACRVEHPDFDKIQNSSYRYQELLGHVWRESVESKLNGDEKALPCAVTLFQRDHYSFISDLIKLSGLSPREWIKEYFKCIFIPLYHLQVEHGIGLVAHGQNTILVHSKGIPKRLIIKDFHGDLRLSTSSKHATKQAFCSLDQLKPEHLIHDLFTGHGVSLLRYLSRILKDFNLLDEFSFYKILNNEINYYHQSVQRPSDKINLLRPELERVLVNKVRFHFGYDEHSRPLPMLGTPLANPISLQGVHNES